MIYTKDSIYQGQITFYQPQKGYRIAVDPLLLAATANINPNQKILDLGAGCGAISLCIAHRFKNIDFSITAIENQKELLEICQKNITSNQFNNLIQTQECCVELATKFYPTPAFDQVYINPPYYDSGKTSSAATKKASHHENIPLNIWIKAAFALTKHKGYVTLIFDTKRLQDLLGEILNYQWGDIHILPISPRANQKAHRVILRLRKTVSSPMKILPALHLHETGKDFTKKADLVINKGQFLPLD